ncbi:DUF4390 domain-containing protein [Variovorax guangxiensis]|uniref:DUF4390 domain-containing protein n=1 Tax=Variovorax guangxiensis TaxID=1775474 RepID=A0A502DEH6_9BURK|nr:DUF4390 domain-containing protein [Variovorax guangxiensis]TPG16549.1 DUF4390 domain-containing protein [Variovorax ginsengisoli]TPG22829.1 DUF4390 domain-containing protein [Variovorax guangxiensis]
MKPTAWLCLCLAGLLFLCGLWPTPAAAQGHTASVTQLRLEHGDDGIYLHAAVQFELPALVQDVLDKGIAVHFVAEAEIYRERWYWTDRKVAQVARYMRLAYQPLTRRWRLNVAPVPITGNAGFGISLNQNFESLDEALDAVKRIGRMRLGDVADIGDDATHPVVFRFRLDTSQLPRPFQIGVVGQSEWDIATERSARLPVEKAR